MKRYEDWQSKTLSEFLQVGDVVDEAFYDYFLNVLPPVRLTDTLLQMGEPYNVVGQKFTYSTLVKTEKGWMYAGHCFIGESEHVA